MRGGPVGGPGWQPDSGKVGFVGGTGRDEKVSGSGICTTTEHVVATQGKYQIRTWSYATDGAITD